MTRYGAYGRVIESACLLPDLTPAAHPHPDLRVELSRGAVPDADWAWITPTEVGDADPWLRVALGCGGYRLSFAPGADFVVSPGLTRVTAAHAGADLETFRHLLIDQVIPLVLSHRGLSFLHASAVAIGGAAIAFVGSSGSGKSTLTGSFGLEGAAILADDALALEMRDRRWWAVPSYAGLRIWPDLLHLFGAGEAPPVAGHSDKRRLGPSDRLTFCHEALPLGRVYIIGDAEGDPVIRPVSRRDAVMALVGQTFVLDPGDGARLEAQLEWVCAVTGAVDVRALAYPRDPARLPDVRRAVQRDLAA